MKHPYFRMVGALVLGCLSQACSDEPATQAPAETAPVADAGAGRILQTRPAPPGDGAIYSIGEWPRYPQALENGEGRELTESVCSACHSTSYIIGQPPLDAAAWKAEVRKMVEAYGASIPAGGESKITSYLTAHYGPSRKPPAAPGASPKGDTSRGQRVYLTNCLPCHQYAGTGLPGAFPPLAGHVPTLLRTEAGRIYLPKVVLYGLTGEIKAKGLTFNNMMTPFGQLPDEDLAAVLNYVATAWGNDQMLNNFVPFVAADITQQRAQEQTPRAVRATRP